MDIPRFDISDLFREGHYVLSSGLHTRLYANHDEFLIDPERLSNYSAEIARRMAGEPIDYVLGPPGLGNAIAAFVAYHLGCAIAISDRNSDGEIYLKHRMQRYLQGKMVLVVDDVLTSGKTLMALSDLVEHHCRDASVFGTAVFVNRAPEVPRRIKFARFESVIHKPIEAWPSHMCPLCRDGVPINTDYGHGLDYKVNHRRA